MKSTIIGIFAALACLGQTFEILHDSPDGVYAVPIDTNGTALAIPIAIPSLSAKMRRGSGNAQLETRALPNPSTGWYVLLSPGVFSLSYPHDFSVLCRCLDVKCYVYNTLSQ
jgi:hypothetical protein